MKKLLCSLMALLVSCSFAFADYDTLAISGGYNADVIANGIGSASTTTTAGVDNQYAYYGDGWQTTSTATPDTNGLPANGLINSQLVSNLQFQLADYSSNNSLRLQTGDSGSLALQTPTAAQTLYILAVSGAGNATMSVTIYYSDLTSQTDTGVQVHDWYDGSDIALDGFERVNLSDNSTGSSFDGPNLYQYAISIPSANQTKTIDSVHFHYTWGDGILNVFALSILEAPLPCSGQPVAGAVDSTPFSVCNGEAFSLTDTGATFAAGMTYQWQERNPAGTGTWTDIAGATDTVLTLSGGISSATDYRFYLVCNSSTLSDTSSVLSVTMNDPLSCYCTPSYSFGCSSGDEIDNFVLLGENGTAIQDLNSSCSGGYSDLTDSFAAVDMVQTFSYTASVTSNTSGDYAVIWIDFNDDGIFENSEKIGISPSSTGFSNYALTVPMTIPATADSGVHRMRVMVGYSGDPTDSSEYAPCNDGGSPRSYGETQDYLVHIMQLVPCSGQPEAGAIDTTDTFAVCSTFPFLLTDTGHTIASGISYQWQQRNPAGTGVWTDIAGDTTAVLDMPTGITAATDYRFYVVCNNSGMSDTSTVVSVTMTPQNQCYCIPGGSVGDYYIDDFSTTGGIQNISNLSSGYSPNGYGYFITDTVAQLQTQTVNFSANYTGGTFGTKIWVDWNQDGVFDASEIVYQSSGYFSNATGSFMVPADATPGATRMRIGIDWGENDGPDSACAFSGNNAFEDYIFNVVELTSCNGQPFAGAVDTSDTISVCSGVSFTLTDTTATLLDSISYQWQQRDPAGTWTDIAGDTTTILTLPNGITDTTEFRLYLVCEATGLSDTTSVVTAVLTPQNQCYCTPDGSTGDNYINNFVTTGGLQNITNLNSGYSPNGYGAFTYDTASQMQTQSISFAAGYVGGSFGTKIWIDWNQNGVFDTNEVVYQSSSYDDTANSSFIVPVDATPGPTRMRIGIDYFNDNGPDSACESSSDNAYEDYIFNVVALPQCAGTPSAGTIDTTASFGVCSGEPFGLSVNGFTIAANITYQWQQRNPSGTGAWTDIVGDTIPVLAVPAGITSATDFRLYVVCGNSNLADTSNVVTATINPWESCYCVPSNTVDTDFYISNFTTTGALENVNQSSGFSSNGYGDYTTTDTIKAIPNSTVNISASHPSSTYKYRIWVDWNRDGDFADPGEMVLASNGYVSSPFTGSFTVPDTISYGAMRLRIRNNYLGDNPVPCGDVDDGETEDYTFVVAPSGACDTTNLNAFIAALVDEDTICASSTIHLSVDTNIYLSGLTFQWQQSLDGTTGWTNVDSPASTANLTVSNVDTNTWYRCQMLCQGLVKSTTAALPVTIITPTLETIPNDTAFCGSNAITLTATANAGAVVRWYNDDTAATPVFTGNAYTTGTLSQTDTFYLAAASDAGVGCASARQPVVVTVHPLPVVNLGADTFICPSSTGLTLDAGNSGSSFLWNSGDTTQTITVDTTGNYKVTVTDGFGCVNEDSIQVSVGTLPVNNLSDSVDLCAEDTITLDAGNSGSTYLWSTGEVSQTIPVDTAGNYSVTVINTQGCTQSFQTEVVLHPLPVGNLTPDTTICSNDAIVLDAGNSGYNYQWNTGATTQTISVTDSGTYSVTITTPYQCVLSDTEHLHIYPAAMADGFNFIPLFYQQLGKVKFVPVNPIHATAYLWDFGDGSQDTSEIVTHTYANTGDYLVTLTVSNGCGSYSVSQTIHVDLQTGIVSVKTNEKAGIILYPNPAKDRLTIETSAADVKMKHITIYSALGRKVYDGTIDNLNKKVIATGQLASGVYSILIQTNKHITIARKFEIAR